MFSWFKKKNPPLVNNQPLVITRTNADLTTIINEAFQSKNRHLQIKEIGLISKSEFKALIDGLTGNTTIKILTLKIKELESDMYRQLGQAVNQRLQMLVIEILDTNNDRIIVPHELMEVLSTNRNLMAIIFLNIIDDNVAIKLLELFKNNNNITYAVFAKNQISEQTKENIISFLKENVNKEIYLSLDEVPK